jgi:superfamily I DNA and/or RNA helicase
MQATYVHMRTHIHVDKQHTYTHLLQVQYRMHPALSAFPNRQFYKSQLIDGVQPHQRSPPKGLHLPVPDVPMAMIDGEGTEVRVLASMWRFHVCEWVS